MRVDFLLNKLCLTKTRSIAKNACDKGLVMINDKVAKASSNVSEGDIIDLKLYGYHHKFKILKIPQANVAKKDASSFYEMISRQPLD